MVVGRNQRSSVFLRECPGLDPVCSEISRRGGNNSSLAQHFEGDLTMTEFGDLRSDGVPVTGIVTEGKTFYLDPTGGSTSGAGGSPEEAQSSLATAYGYLTDNKNDVLNYFSGVTGVTLTEGLTWAKSYTSLIGRSAPSLYNTRARIGHAGTIVPTLLTVSGSSNHFKNIYLMHGISSATEVTCLSVTGSRNVFEKCHIGGPMDATQAASANQKTLSIAGAENYFKNCVIGVDTIARTAAGTLLNLASGSKRNVFEDCIFLTSAGSGGTGTFHITVAAGCDRYSLFRNCQFINWSANQAYPLTYLISWGSSTTSTLYFDNRCGIAGITDVVATGDVGKIWWGTTTTTANVLGLYANPAVS